MGPESKIEFCPGTLYFIKPGSSEVISAAELKEASIFTEDNSVEIDDVPNIVHLTEPIEFTGNCGVTFRGLVLLVGFWPAVKWTIGTWRARVRNWWKLLRTPIEEDKE